MSSTLTGVCVPVYVLGPGQVLRAVENASSVANEYTDDAVDFYSLAMAELLAATQVAAGAIIVLPRWIKVLIFRSWRRVR
jgi:hypothetical protein